MSVVQRVRPRLGRFAVASGEGDQLLLAVVANPDQDQVRAADDRNPRQSFYWEVKAVRADVEPLDAEQPKGEGEHADARQAKRGTRMPELQNVT